MDIELVSKIILIIVYSLFSIIRIEYYRRTKKAGYSTVIEERKKYSIWLGLFICYTVFTFFIYIFFPQALIKAKVLLPSWLRFVGAFMAILALLWFISIHRSLGSNHSVKLKIKESQKLITDGPYRWIRHPMYSAFFMLHIATFLLTANWFIGLTWMGGLAVIIFLRVKREEAMLLSAFGGEYRSYMEKTGRFFPVFKNNKK
jgi:protein-S-isoprenylcysteine O-methyltransferase Ste14